MGLTLQQSRYYYNQCNPDQSLAPDDARIVDIDEHNPRGKKWAEKLARIVDLSIEPVCELFTGLPGSGKSTELRRLAAILSAEPTSLLPVIIDAGEVLDLSNSIDIIDLMIAVVSRTDEEILVLEGRTNAEPLQESFFTRIWNKVTQTDVAAKAEVGITGAKIVTELKTRPSLRKQARERLATQLPSFLEEVRQELENLQKRSQKKGRAGLLVIFDTLEKLRGTSETWEEVINSVERTFSQNTDRLKLPVHVFYTVPPSLTLRTIERVHFIPMIKIFDQQGNEHRPGFDATEEIIRKRLPDLELRGLFGDNVTSRLHEIIKLSGGYPRQIISLLRRIIEDAPPSGANNFMTEGTFRSILNQAGNEIRRTLLEESFDWLARVAIDHTISHRLSLEDQSQREAMDRMIANNVVLRYQDDDGNEWFDINPAVRNDRGIQIAIERLNKSRATQSEV
jgi:hypothetical protein